MTNSEIATYAIEFAREHNLMVSRPKLCQQDGFENHCVIVFWAISEPFPNKFVESSFSYDVTDLESITEASMRTRCSSTLLAIQEAERLGAETGQLQGV